MEKVKELFWCDARDEQGHLQHAPDCEQRDCFVVQGKKQEGSLVPPHTRRHRPSENKGPSVSMKVLMTATLIREAVL